MSLEGDAVAFDLRAWAEGVAAVEAAVELLARGYGGLFVEPGWPWIVQDEASRCYWVDLVAIPDLAVPLEEPERAFMWIAASIGCSRPGDTVPTISAKLHDPLASLRHDQLGLVLAAISHAAGTHEVAGFVIPPPSEAIRYVTYCIPIAERAHYDIQAIAAELYAIAGGWEPAAADSRSSWAAEFVDVATFADVLEKHRRPTPADPT